MGHNQRKSCENLCDCPSKIYIYRNSCKQTVKTLIRPRVLIWVCTVCICPKNVTVGLYGLIKHLTFFRDNSVCLFIIISRWKPFGLHVVMLGLKDQSPFLYMGPVKRICVFEHSVMTNFNCACPAIQLGQWSGFLSQGSSWFTACMSEQRRCWRDCADAQARLNLRCSHRR